MLLQILYSIRSERLLMEELDYSVLYRWFVGLSMDDPVWDATTFTKNRERLLRGDVADAFFAEVLAAIRAEGLLSDEHFTVDGTLLEAWASHKSFRPKDDDPPPPDDPKNPTVNFHGQPRRNDTHQSTTDPEARLYKKAVGREAKLGYLAHLLTENRHGFIIDTAVSCVRSRGADAARRTPRYAAVSSLWSAATGSPCCRDPEESPTTHSKTSLRPNTNTGPWSETGHGRRCARTSGSSSRSDTTPFVSRCMRR